MQEQFRRRRLPHWDVPGAVYFVTSCLAGSIPAQGLLRIRETQEQLLSSRPNDLSPEWELTLPKGKTGREVIMHSIQSYTAHDCNQILRARGAFWQGESLDHCVRDEGELERILDYIELNPAKAKLCASREEWHYSSAYGRGAGVSPARSNKP